MFFHAADEVSSRSFEGPASPTRGGRGSPFSPLLLAVSALPAYSAFESSHCCSRLCASKSSTCRARAAEKKIERCCPQGNGMRKLHVYLSVCV